MQGLNQAARDLQAAAPVDHGWGNPTDASDQAATAAMKEAWGRTRFYWEQAESTLGDGFPLLDASMDSRYEDALAANGGQDADLLDGAGVTGMHAIERILYAPGPPAVVAYELSLPGYRAAAWPVDAPQAAEFKAGLCQKLVDDSKSLLDQWGMQTTDLAAVFSGLTGLMSAQAEKVGLAVSHQEESRYSQETMLDLRWNLKGTEDAYSLFTPWLATKDFGATLDKAARTALDGLELAYGSADSIPPPPATWNSANPSPEDQQSPFGKLYEAVIQDVDPSRTGSAIDALNQVAKALGLPLFGSPSP
jgi:iron uptake system component EfeO